MAATPYETNLAHLADELRRLDVRLRIHLEEWWSEGGGRGEFGGLYISDEEIDRLLKLPQTIAGDGGQLTASTSAPDHGLRERYESLTREIRARERRTLGTATDLRLVELADRFDLGSRHRDALVMALAPELDRKYEKIYAYLQDDVTRTRPTVELLIRIMSEGTAQRLAIREGFSARSPLVRAGPTQLVGEAGTPLPSHSVAVADRIVEYLLDSANEPAVSDLVTVVDPVDGIRSLPVEPAVRQRLTRLVEPTGDHRERFAYFHGPYGSQKHDAVAAVCADAGRQIVRADAADLGLLDGEGCPPRDRSTSAGRAGLDEVVREARLRDAAIHLTNVPPEPDESTETRPPSPANVITTISNAIDHLDAPVFLTGDRPVTPRLGARLEDWAFDTIGFGTPGFARRRELWQAVEALPDDVDPADLASKFRLTAGQIEDAKATARTIANGQPPTAAAVYAACREQSRQRLGSLAKAVQTGYDWEDIVLPPDTMAHLREVAAHVNHQGQVYSDWGFEAKYSLGNGLNVLFTGPSGTGKTMAAEIVAGEAGLDLYRIDLASVVSKYIGETEENLKAVFDEAEGSNAVLFFDEADALFGERSEVSDAQDRYANVEVSYLLQRMEDHDGTVILASNLKENIDDAFLRRINLSVEFPMPDRKARAEIWRNVFPEETPVEELDVEFLAGFDLAGGNIKNAALTAAFLAAEDGIAVGMEHIVQALKRELEKTGRLVNPGDFGEYSQSIRG